MATAALDEVNLRISLLTAIRQWRRAAISACLTLSLCASTGCSRETRVEERPRRVDVVLELDGVKASLTAISPDAKAAAILDSDGNLRAYDAAGTEKLWVKAQGAQMMAIANEGHRIITAGIERKTWWVKILNSHGSILWRQRLDGEVIGMAIAPDGRSAFVSTTGLRMYVFDLSTSPKWRRVHTDKNLESLEYNTIMDALIARTSDPSGFGLFDISGAQRWWIAQPSGMFTMEPCAQDGLILTTLAHLTPTPHFEIALYSAVGRRLLWQKVDGYEPRAAVSANGKLLAMSYRRKLAHKRASVMERRIALWTASGDRLWEEGGLFFKPVLIAVAEQPDGVIVAEDYSLLSALNKFGRLAWRGPALGSGLVRLEHDQNWELAWARFRNGEVELWRLNGRG